MFFRSHSRATWPTCDPVVLPHGPRVTRRYVHTAAHSPLGHKSDSKPQATEVTQEGPGQTQVGLYFSGFITN